MIAVLSSLLVAALAAGDSAHYRLYKFERAIGSERDLVVHTAAGDTVVSLFSFTDRGTTVTLHTSLVVRPDGTPAAFTARGQTSRSSTADLAITIGGDGGVTVRSGRDSTARRVAGAFFPSAGYAPVIGQQALIHYWLSHGRPERIALVPTGSVRIEDRGPDTLTIGDRPVVLRRIGIRDLVWGRETVWLDGDGNLVALVTRDAEFDHFEAAAPGYEDAVPAFVRRAAADEMAELAEITRGAGKDGDFAVVGATLIDGTGRPAVRDAVVVVRGGRIAAAGPRARVRVPRGLVTVDGRGRTVLPGLWDMHAHVEQVDWGPLYLAAGITTVRDVGNEEDFVVAMRDALRRGRGVGPRMLLAGIIDGEGPRAVGIDNATTPADGVRLVDAYAAAGFDQIKVYSSIAPDVLRAVTAAAHAKHLTVTGHVPTGMTIFDAVGAGMDQVNHITYVSDVAKDSAFKPGPGAAVAPLDSARLRRVVTFLAAHHTVIDPTMALFDLYLRPDSLPVTAIEPGAAKVAAPLREALLSGGVPSAQAAAARRREENLIAIIGALHRGGVTIVAGTDQAVPGHSLHRELELYVRAGFTPMEAIQAATSVPARVMGVTDAGTVEPGKRADLLLVDGDPLARITDTRRIRLVVAGGRRFEPAPLWRSVGFEP